VTVVRHRRRAGWSWPWGPRDRQTALGVRRPNPVGRRWHGVAREPLVTEPVFPLAWASVSPSESPR